MADVKSIIYDLEKMEYIRSKRGRLDDYKENGSGKPVRAKCLTHDFICQPTEGEPTTGKAGDYLVDEGDSWRAVPQAEFYPQYTRIE